MKVPFCDLGRLYREQGQTLASAVEGVLESGWYVLGERCAAFERQMATSLGLANDGGFIGCNSGTDALALGLLAVGVGPGDEVIAPAHTAAPTACAIRVIGAQPVFADIDPQTWVIHPASIEAALSDRTRAVVPVHLYGAMADVPAIAAMLSRRGRDDVSIVEDAAQAQGASWAGHAAGTLGAAGAFSFYPTKNIGALGDGGGVVAHSKDALERLRMLRFYGQKDRYNAQLSGGINSRLDEIQAAVLSCRLPNLADWNSRKQWQVQAYRSAFKRLPLRFQATYSTCEPAWHLLVIALDDASLRDPLIWHLSRQQIQSMVHYPLPLHQQEAFAGCRHPPLPMAEDLTRRIVSLPMNPVLSADELAWVIESVNSFPAWSTAPG